MDSKTRILITGSSGQLGQEFLSYFKNTNFIVKALSRNEVDFSKYEEITRLESEISLFRPNFLINCAAYTAVDLAEEQIELAEVVNAKFLNPLGELAEKLNFYILHFSTDYVFDGESNTPYKETDICHPINAYGKTKRAGERILLASARSLTLRVSWLYSEYGTNFPKTIHRLLSEKSELDIVNDQVSSPTWARPLVKFVVSNVLCNANLFKGSLYHYSENGEGSWYDMALIINDFHKKKLSAVSSEEFAQLAKRPSYSKLDNSLAKEVLGLNPSSWQENLRTFLKIIQ